MKKEDNEQPNIDDDRPRDPTVNMEISWVSIPRKFWNEVNNLGSRRSDTATESCLEILLRQPSMNLIRISRSKL